MTILPVTYRELLDAPEWPALEAEYASECALPELGPSDPQRVLYAAMEASGGLQCFGVYSWGRLVGFISLLIYILPHYGKRIATTESIFLRKDSCGGLRMLRFIEGYARDTRCESLLLTAPKGGRFERLLTALKKYRHCNNVFVRVL